MTSFRYDSQVMQYDASPEADDEDNFTVEFKSGVTVDEPHFL
jgi:hypothetical protein